MRQVTEAFYIWAKYYVIVYYDDKQIILTTSWCDDDRWNCVVIHSNRRQELVKSILWCRNVVIWTEKNCFYITILIIMTVIVVFIINWLLFSSTGLLLLMLITSTTCDFFSTTYELLSADGEHLYWQPAFSLCCQPTSIKIYLLLTDPPTMVFTLMIKLFHTHTQCSWLTATTTPTEDHREEWQVIMRVISYGSWVSVAWTRDKHYLELLVVKLVISLKGILYLFP